MFIGADKLNADYGKSSLASHLISLSSPGSVGNPWSRKNSLSIQRISLVCVDLSRIFMGQYHRHRIKCILDAIEIIVLSPPHLSYDSTANNFLPTLDMLSYLNGHCHIKPVFKEYEAKKGTWMSTLNRHLKTVKDWHFNWHIFKPE